MAMLNNQRVIIYINHNYFFLRAPSLFHIWTPWTPWPRREVGSGHDADSPGVVQVRFGREAADHDEGPAFATGQPFEGHGRCRPW